MRSLFRLAALFILMVAPLAGADADPAALLRAGEADKAIHALNLAATRAPNDARSYNLLCRVYFQLEMWDEAVRMCEKAVNLEPPNSSYHQWLGRSMGRKAEVANPFTAFNLARKVKTEFERAVTLDGNNLSARSDLSEFYLEAPGFLGGDKNKAKQQADYVAQHDRALASYIYARVQEKQGNTGAEAEYKKAIAASSQPARYWVELAHFYRRTGRMGEMEDAIRRAVGTVQQGEPSEFDAAALLVHSGRNFAGAAQMLRHYVSEEGPSEDGPAFRAHYLLGVVLEKQGKKKEAAAEFQTALNMASEYRPAQDALARVSR